MTSFLRHSLALLLAASTLGACDSWHTSTGIATASPAARGTWLVDGHEIRLDGESQQLLAPVSLRIRLAGQSVPVFDTLPAESPLLAGYVEMDASEARGMARITTRVRDWCRETHFTQAHVTAQAVAIDGQMNCPKGLQKFTLTIARAHAATGSAIAIDITLGDGPANHITLRAASTPGEQVFGGGVQFGKANLKGYRLPVIASEQGVGRSKQPLTFFANQTNDGAGGAWHTSYAGVPHVMTSERRSVFVDTHAYTTINAADAQLLQFDVQARTLHSVWRQAASPLALIEAHTADVGRMRVPPDWLDRGAIIGMQGGTQAVRDKLSTLEKAGVPLAGFWLQDWVGQRSTSFGKQLWWNWTLDETRYPGWNDLRKDLAQRKIRLLGYANTLLVDLDDDKRRHLIREAREHGYLVKGPDGQPLMSLNTSFSAAHVDLANPKAYAWLKQVLKEEMLARGFSGWMADFAEGLPFDAQSPDGKPGGVELHNSWPERWAQLNRELIDENGLAKEAVAFHRSGWSRSPHYATLFWLGDQLVDWGPEDGLASALTGLLTGGLSGFAINHSDIGGYTTITNTLLSYTRSKELFMRWTEFAAFTPVFRTHEGNRPDANWQFDSDAETLAHFARMSRLFGCWRTTRQQLFLQAQHHGLPVNRLMWLHYPQDARFVETTPRQMLVGPDILVAPVLTPKATTVTVTIPENGWQHLWSGEEAGTGVREWPAPIGQPAVFVRSGSAAAQELRACAATLPPGLSR